MVATGRSMGNFWERDPENVEADSPLRDLVLLTASLDAGNRERGEAGYLLPPADSKLREGGAGDPFSKRVGADLTNHPDRQVR